ncbi:MAG TPA: TolC family outer membrane protein [Gammaproteobacteria bacterium]|nr:TolC family outer membrane protein [Gammaproteobacteria bacterium]
MRKTTLALAIAAALGVATQTQAADLWDTYQLAVNNDPTYLQAEANYEAAIEAKPIARAGYLPNITFTGTRYRSESGGDQIGVSNTTPPTIGLQNFTSTTYQTQYQFQLTQPIFNWAAWQTIDQADASAAQAEANWVVAQQSLILRTATAYFNVLNARDTLAADHAATEANSKQLEQAKEKYDVGMSAITDVQEAQAAYDQSVANEINAQQQVTNAEESLRAITGQPVGDLLEPSPDMPLRSPEPGNAQQWVDQALKQNPNLLAAQSAADAADANVGIKRAGHFPTLNAIAQHTKTDDTGNNIFDLSHTTGNFVELQLSVPIFSGGGVWAQVNQAQRQYDAAVDNVKLVTRQTEQQARTAYLGVLTGISQVNALKQSVKSNQTSMDATETGMQVGTRTIVDVLTARQNLLTAQTNFANARYTYLENVLQLKQAAGNLNEGDLKQMNVVLQVKAPGDSMGTDTTTLENGTEMAPAAGTSAIPAAAAPAPSAAPAAGTTTPPASTPPKR